MTTVSRETVRVMKSYQMASKLAVLVLAGVVSVDLLARDRKMVHKGGDVPGRRRVKKEARALTVTLVLAKVILYYFSSYCSSAFLIILFERRKIWVALQA